MNNSILIDKAAATIFSVKTKGGLIGDVGCALLTKDGNLYTGVCASTGSNTFCAEQNAIGSMITNREYAISKIVAVWKNESGEVFVISPCGNCRQMMYEMSGENLNAEIILDKDNSKTLSELLPDYSSWKRQ
ncbi:hypothetical protein OFY17_11125 [Marinomonas sp. C2222]|uniref:CMP/dCMP-type deaminase domain-containing protein n=1 Tax=Marinomonas sargassi TaxID=2984494 RepID=A0ABT2YUJ1_9GAMM|nr:hypothetical protein [Marinomonas sargassi]MCV2403430.1 hypothetical protein [Marinomonas sargassi]